MTEHRDVIKKWLKSHKKNYAWLARQCFVGEGTVKNWMSTKPIPEAKLALIKTMINTTNTNTRDANQDRNHWQSYAVTMEHEDYCVIERAAIHAGMSVEEWSEQILTEQAMTFLERKRSATGLAGKAVI